MDPLHATLEEFAADGYTHVEANCPRCRVIRLRPIDQLPKISLGLTLDARSFGLPGVDGALLPISAAMSATYWTAKSRP